MGRLVLGIVISHAVFAALVGLVAMALHRPFFVGASAALVGVAVYALPLLLARAVLGVLVKVPVPLLGFFAAHGLKVALTVAGLVLVAIRLKSDPDPFVARDLVWVVAGFVSAAVTYFFVMRKS